ncbi:hypothetical protein T492DRAFT_1048473 [Pavlovales sp. CCMP2436]|nr:hypothetical protein T492DRAFT_1048473 [Pavlovales sp. CCMP2436]
MGDYNDRGASRNDSSYGTGTRDGYVARRPQEYQRALGDQAEINVAAVTLLVGERSALRAARDFDGADAVRAELKNMGVTVFDKDLTWFVGSPSDAATGDRGGYDERGARRAPLDFGPLGHDYTRSSTCMAPLSTAQIETVNVLLAARLDAKISRDFDEADAAYAKIKEIGVTVFDKQKTWFVGSHSDAPRDRGDTQIFRGERRNFGPLGHDYTRADNDVSPMMEAQVKAVNALLASRLAAKMSRDFDGADADLRELKEVHRVFVNDKLKGWRADGLAFPTHARVPGDDDVQVDEAYVQDILRQRSLAKKEQDYDTADALAQQLKDELNVWTDDKRGTWCIGRPPRPSYAERPGDAGSRSW